MENKRFTLSKEERLSWKRHIDVLFEKGESFISFPLRVVYLPAIEQMPSTVSMLVSIPKKRFKRAVKRNLLKRQVREAFRLDKYKLVEPLEAENKQMMVAFLYVDKEVHSFNSIEKAMSKALNMLCNKL
jgi:ribonuclease P protein component